MASARPGSVWASRARTGEAMLLLVSARLARATSRVNARFQRMSRAAASVDDAGTTTLADPLDRLVAGAVLRASWRLPFETNCVDRAFAGRRMLERRGEHPHIVFGIDRTDPTRETHTWLVSEHGGVVTGADVVDSYAPVTVYR